MNRQLRIVYMGTPEFAVSPLKAILSHGYDVVAVVTAPDKPAGRGLTIRQSPVKEFAIRNSLTVFQPFDLKDPAFIQELDSYGANLQVVVAFRMLPEIIWSMPEYGTFNLHASLLPQYRGAAPINWALINGEKETGLTTFLLTHEIDTGNILFQERCPIYPDDDAGKLHDRLARAGEGLVIKTIEAIRQNSVNPVSQDSLIEPELKLLKAPKLFKQDCRIHWGNTTESIYNLIRGLSPAPAAFTSLLSPEGGLYNLKIFRTGIDYSEADLPAGAIHTDGRHFLKVRTADGWLDILELQAEGKKRLLVVEFLRGFRMDDQWKMV